MGECRPELLDYADHLAAGTDDDDDDMRDSISSKRYEQDLRWLESWLDEAGIESALEVSRPDGNRIGRALSQQFNGTTPRYRWDRLLAMYDYFVGMEMIEENPLSYWDDKKKESWGMTKTTEQEKHLEDDEKYAVSQEQVRMMEQNVGRNRLRDQLVIRCLWHSAMRREEASQVTIDMLDRENREITLPSAITKNNKKRVVTWQPNLDGLLQKWLDGGYREEYLGGENHDFLFVGERGARLSADAINDIVNNAADRAGINRKLYRDANAAEPAEGEDPEPNRWKITSHSIRKGMATILVKETDADIYAVSKYLGHSSVDITERRYVEYDPRAGADDVHEFGVE